MNTCTSSTGTDVDPSAVLVHVQPVVGRNFPYIDVYRVYTAVLLSIREEEYVAACVIKKCTSVHL